MAEGRAGFGEAAPGDHLQTGYQLWLVGAPARARAGAVAGPVQLPARGRSRAGTSRAGRSGSSTGRSRAFGAVLGWNVFVLLGFLGAGGLTALWLRQLGLPRGASLAGGLAFALAPYLQAQWSAGHLLAWVAMLLPLALYAVERARQGSLWWLVLAGAALVSVPLSGQLHLALGVIPFFVLYALVRLPWAALLALPALAAGLLANALVVRDTTGAHSRSFHQVEHFSAGLSGFVSRDSELLEQMVYLGWSVLVLAIAGFVVLLLGAAGEWPRCSGSARSSRSCSPSARTRPATRRCGGTSPVSSTRACRSGSCPSPAWRSPRSWPSPSPALRWPGTAAIVVLVLLIDLPLSLFHATGSDQGNRVYAAVRCRAAWPNARATRLRAGEPERQRLPLLPDAGPARAPAGYTTTAPVAADTLLRALKANPVSVPSDLGITTIVAHYKRKNPCGGRLIARSGVLSAYSVR